jgi:hypothetical protein
MTVIRRHLIDPPQLIRRNSFAPTLKEVLSETEDIKLYLFMSPSFLAYASDLIRQALVECGLIGKDEKGPNILYNVLVHRAEGDNYSKQNPVLVCWRINAVVAWQQVDRRVDECVSAILVLSIFKCSPFFRLFEVLWAFYHSYSNVSGASETDIVRRILSEISRRAIRLTPKDEFMAFAGWVARAPPTKNKGHQDHLGTGEGKWSWDTDEEDANQNKGHQVDLDTGEDEWSGDPDEEDDL